MSIKGVLFDKDGVLVDFDATWCPATVKVIDSFGGDDPDLRAALADVIRFDREAMRFHLDSVFIAGTSSDLIDLWAPLLPSLPKYALGQQARALFTRFGAEHVTAYDDVAQTLTALGAARIAMGLATNDEEVSGRTQLRALSLDGRFSFVAGSDSGHGAKPDPGMLLAFADHISARPEEIVMVGDSTHDLHAASAAGMIAVAVGTGPAMLEDLRPHADHCIERLGKLPDLISSL